MCIKLFGIHVVKSYLSCYSISLLKNIYIIMTNALFYFGRHIIGYDNYF